MDSSEANWLNIQSCATIFSWQQPGSPAAGNMHRSRHRLPRRIGTHSNRQHANTCWLLNYGSFSPHARLRRNTRISAMWHNSMHHRPDLNKNIPINRLARHCRFPAGLNHLLVLPFCTQSLPRAGCVLSLSLSHTHTHTRHAHRPPCTHAQN